MKTMLFVISLVLSSPVFAVAGSGSGIDVAGSGSGIDVAGSGSGTDVAGSGSGTDVAGSGSGTDVAGSGSGTDVAGSGSGTDVAGSGSGTDAVALDACYSGSWYDPLNPGAGISVEILEDQVVVYFYTWNADGQTWYIFQGDNAENLNAYDLYENGEALNIGSGSFTPTSDNDAYFTYNFLLDLDDTKNIPWCLHDGCVGEFAYVRLTQPIPCAGDVEIAGAGTGKEIAGAGTGKEIAGAGTGKD